ncbi:MAG: patatin-like phospholipase family protein [Planctomycetes bacterium]|nr:patatin-like phospholipase family protein [Planctomycetota bacterium]
MTSTNHDPSIAASLKFEKLAASFESDYRSIEVRLIAAKQERGSHVLLAGEAVFRAEEPASRINNVLSSRSVLEQHYWLPISERKNLQERLSKREILGSLPSVEIRTGAYGSEQGLHPPQLNFQPLWPRHDSRNAVIDRRFSLTWLGAMPWTSIGQDAIEALEKDLPGGFSRIQELVARTIPGCQAARDRAVGFEVAVPMLILSTTFRDADRVKSAIRISRNINRAIVEIHVRDMEEGLVGPQLHSQPIPVPLAHLDWKQGGAWETAVYSRRAIPGLSTELQVKYRGEEWIEREGNSPRPTVVHSADRDSGLTPADSADARNMPIGSGPKASASGQQLRSLASVFTPAVQSARASLAARAGSHAQTKPAPPQIGLALSGGGFRASLFHLGALRFLKDADLLQHVSDIASISGGSILGAHFALNRDAYLGSTEDFDKAATAFLSLVRRDVRGRVERRFLFAWLPLIGWMYAPWAKRTRLLRKEYESLLGSKSLRDLGDAFPRLHILATSFTSGELITFDSVGVTLGTAAASSPCKAPGARISLAVTSSSAFQPIFPPLTLDAKALGVKQQQFPLTCHAVDGGVFDNLGIEKLIWLASRGKADLTYFVISDAQADFDWETGKAFGSVYSRATRATEILMKRISDLLFEKALQHSENNAAEIMRIQEVRLGIARPRPTYIRFSLSTDDTYREESTGIARDIAMAASQIRTDLNDFSDIEIDLLTRLGYAKCRAQFAQSFQLKADLLKAKPWSPITGRPSETVEHPKLKAHLEHSKIRPLGIISARDHVFWFGLLVAVLTLLIPVSCSRAYWGASRREASAEIEKAKQDIYRETAAHHLDTAKLLFNLAGVDKLNVDARTYDDLMISALERCARAWQIDGHDPAIAVNYAYALNRLDKHSEAAAVLEEIFRQRSFQMLPELDGKAWYYEEMAIARKYLKDDVGYQFWKHKAIGSAANIEGHMIRVERFIDTLEDERKKK